MTQEEFQRKDKSLKTQLDDVVEKHRQKMLITAWSAFAVLILYAIIAFCIGILPWIRMAYYLTH